MYDLRRPGVRASNAAFRLTCSSSGTTYSEAFFRARLLYLDGFDDQTRCTGVLTVNRSAWGYTTDADLAMLSGAPGGWMRSSLSAIRGQSSAQEKMSALLLDTHIWLWYAEGSADRLWPKSVRRLDAARRRRPGHSLHFSVGDWRAAGHGLDPTSAPLRDWVAQARSPAGISLVTLDADIAAESTVLPGELHGAPADRFLIATARTGVGVVPEVGVEPTRF